MKYFRNKHKFPMFSKPRRQKKEKATLYFIFISLFSYILQWRILSCLYYKLPFCHMTHHVIYHTPGRTSEAPVSGRLIIRGIAAHVILGVGAEIRKKNRIYTYIIIKTKDMFVVKFWKDSAERRIYYPMDECMYMYYQ